MARSRSARHRGRLLPALPETPVWKSADSSYAQNEEPLLFDRHADPKQDETLAPEQSDTVARMQGLLVTVLDHLDAPARQYERLGLAE